MQKLLSMDMAGNLDGVKPYLNPDSAVYFFDHYALLPPAGLIVSDHCEADLLDLNTGGADTGRASLSGVRGLPMTLEKTESGIRRKQSKQPHRMEKCFNFTLRKTLLSLNTCL